ncbi:MAG TPA: hypothetical protein VK757_09660 [Candidatus Acidoferrum sp.]|nr:hypothetical protein [Candidatus Acidoferrum sp.]
MGKVQKLAVLSALATSLTGCAWHNSGPCYGIGCPTWATAAPQGTAAAPPKSADDRAPAANAALLASGQSTASATNPAAAAPRTAKGDFAQLFKHVKGAFAPAAKPATPSAATPTGSTNGR